MAKKYKKVTYTDTSSGKLKRVTLRVPVTKPERPSRAFDTRERKALSLDVPIPRSKIPEIRRAAERNIKRLTPPPPPKRKGGLGGFLQDITEGRGVLGAATTGPISLFARDDARRALFSGDFNKALKEAVEIGRYTPPTPSLKKKGKEEGAGLGGRGFVDWLGNVNRGINVLPSMFLDVAEVGGKAIAHDVRDRRGLLGVLSTGPIAMVANKESRDALFSGDIEESIKQALPDWDAPEGESSKLAKEIIVGSIHDTKRAFSDPNYWYEDPVNAAFAAAIVLGPVSRAAGIAKTFSKLKAVEGAGRADRFKVAVAENFAPGISGLKQGIRRELPTGRGAETVGVSSSRHPFGRALQRQYDLMTRQLNPESRLTGGLAAPRRARRLEARRTELGQRRLQRDVNYANRKAALYINEGLITKGRGLTGDSLRRGRDAAIVMALQGARDVDAIEAVRYAANDTDEILERGTALAPEGDLADLTVVPAGQEAFLDGKKVQVTSTTVGQYGEPRATGTVIETGETVEGAASRFRLVDEETGDRVRINLTDDQRARLDQRSRDLKEAISELESNPKQAAKFEEAVDVYGQLGALNEDLGHVISRATVGSQEWDNFLEGGRVRRNLMARRWRRQGLRAGEEDLKRPVTDVPERRQFQETLNARMGDAAAPLLYLADNMAQTAAERAGKLGIDFSAADWWKRISETTSGTYRSSDQVGQFLYHDEGVRKGLLRTQLSKPEELGRPLHGSIIRRGSDVHAWSGITDNGDGTVRAWNQQEGWVDDLPMSTIQGGQPFPGYDTPLHVGEKVYVTETGGFGADQAGKIAGYYEHPTRGPEFTVTLDNGTTITRSRSDIQRLPDEREPIFYSKAQEVIAADSFPAKAQPQQVMKALEKAAVKKEEIFWTGIAEFAELYEGKSIPKEDLLNHLENSLNGLNLDETVYSSVGTRSGYMDKWGPSGSYSEGGLIIREPTSEHPYYELVMAMPNKPGDVYTGGHYNVPNMLYHIRFHEIEDLDGVPAILLDELQSDPHAAGRRRGYSQAVPAAIKAQIDALEARRTSITRAQNDIPDGYNIRYDVEEHRKKWAYERIDQMKDEGLENFDSTTYMWADIMRDTDWRDPDIMAQIERAYPGHAEKVKAMDRYTRLETLRTRLNARINDLEQPYAGVVPDLPFKGEAWMGMAMKRLAAWAVDNGQKRVYWTRGHEHMVRYDKIDNLPGGRKAPDPSDYGDEFYDTFGSHQEEFGDHPGFTPTSEFMEEPLEGMNLALLETGEAPIQPRPMGDRMIVDPDDIPEGGQGSEFVMWQGRHARIKGWLDEGEYEGNEHFEIEYLPAKYDPAGARIDASTQGEHGEWNYRVELTNRLGEKYEVDIDSGASPYEYQSDADYNARYDFWDDVAQQIDNQYGTAGVTRARAGVNHAQEHLAQLRKKVEAGESLQAWETIEGAESRLEWAETYLEQAEARFDPDLSTMARVLGDSETGQGMLDQVERNTQTEFSQDRWDDFKAEEGYGEGAGTFEDIRDFDSDLDPGKSHLYFYDTMLPKVVEKTFKPFKTRAFLKDDVYIGRYSTEGEGVISGEGALPAHGFEITEEMADSIRRSRQSLFQQPVDPDAVPKGALEFIKGTMRNPEQVAIRLFDDADASTVVHELGHVALYDLHPRDLRIIEDELQGGKTFSDWERTDYERFARAFERHVMGEPAMNARLVGPFQALAEIMQSIYRTVKGYFDDVPISQAVEDVFDRVVNPRSVDEARSYFPHRSAFDPQLTDFMGGVRLPAGGKTLGIPKQDARAFPSKPNAEVLWETGEMLPSTGALSSQTIRRGRFNETLRLRKRFWDEGHEIKADQGIPPGAYLVRDPSSRLEKIPQRVTAATRLDEQSFRELTGDVDVEDWKEALKNIVMTPDELADVGVDMKNVRWIEPWKVESLVKNVFPSSPSGKGPAALGMLNTVSRMSQIYLRPIRYLTGNVPANVVLQALTNPTALPRSMRYLVDAVRNSAKEFGVGPRELQQQHPALYNAIRADSGDVMAGAGLPEFYTQANNAFQKGERRLTRWSAELSDRLGEVADQPFRVATWITWAKRYGFDTPEEWERLLATRMQTDPSGRPVEQLSPEEARVRDEISQRTREDMIDFNAMTPWERQHIARFFYLWAFTRGFVKWPLTFAREYPERLAAVGLAREQTEGKESERPFAAEWMDARGQSMLRRPDGTSLDFSSWNPVSGGVEAWNTVAGLTRGSVRPLTDYLNPTLSALGEAAFNPTREEGWESLGQEALGAYAPSWAQSALTEATGIETPASRRAEAKGKKGAWAKVNEFLEVDRFSQGKYSPSITKKRTQDWKDLAADYGVTTANYDAEDVTKSFQAYWLYKEYEQRVKYGIGAREGRQGLTDTEKAILLRRVAEETYGDANIASVEDIDKASSDDLKEFVEAMDWMFKPRTGVMSAATRRRNEYEESRKQAQVAS